MKRHSFYVVMILLLALITSNIQAQQQQTNKVGDNIFGGVGYLSATGGTVKTIPDKDREEADPTAKKDTITYEPSNPVIKIFEMIYKDIGTQQRDKDYSGTMQFFFTETDPKASRKGTFKIGETADDVDLKQLGEATWSAILGLEAEYLRFQDIALGLMEVFYHPFNTRTFGRHERKITRGYDGQNIIQQPPGRFSSDFLPWVIIHNFFESPDWFQVYDATANLSLYLGGLSGPPIQLKLSEDGGAGIDLGAGNPYSLRGTIPSDNRAYIGIQMWAASVKYCTNIDPEFLYTKNDGTLIFEGPYATLHPKEAVEVSVFPLSLAIPNWNWVELSFMRVLRNSYANESQVVKTRDNSDTSRILSSRILDKTSYFGARIRWPFRNILGGYCEINLAYYLDEVYLTGQFLKHDFRTLSVDFSFSWRMAGVNRDRRYFELAPAIGLKFLPFGDWIKLAHVFTFQNGVRYQPVLRISPPIESIVQRIRSLNQIAKY